MNPTSIKFKDFRCFTSECSGFDEFKAINVIIGRNNTGKSHLLDAVQLLVESGIKKSQLKLLCRGTLDEDFLIAAFPKGQSSSDLGGDSWENHGSQLIGHKVEWEAFDTAATLDAATIESLNSAAHAKGTGLKAAQSRPKYIQKQLSRVNCHLHGRKFQRILADRDIQPEKAGDALSISPNGTGATHVIQRFILNKDYNEDLIQVHLLDGLKQIFGNDGQFNRIEIRQNDPLETSANDSTWEVYLGERSKKLTPLSRSGSGLKTVILVLLNLFVVPAIENRPSSEFVFAFEELENNLHPALLRRLFKFIADYVEREKCVLFLTTHSSVALDFFGSRADSQIIQVTHDGERAKTKQIMTHFEKTELLSELGCRPSDLLQANGVIWLEGPSDRIYFNGFIELYSNGELREGKDYQCAFYGGSVLAQCEFNEATVSDGEFANLLRLNSNIAVVCDGDRTKDGAALKDRVSRISSEVEKVPNAFLWVTDAKEIENYIPSSVWSAIYTDNVVPDPDKYDTFPKVTSDGTFVLKHLGRKTFDKCEFAMKAVPFLTETELNMRFEFATKIVELVDKIRSWNA